jgi:hypothetical protein
MMRLAARRQSNKKAMKKVPESRQMGEFVERYAPP